MPDRSPQSDPESHEPNHVITGAGGIPSLEAVGIPTIWLSATFAPDWYKDAQFEAKNTGDVQLRRREIIFSVAAAESYLLEWVRDEVLHRDIQELRRYFPPEQRRSITEKWKMIPKQLVDDRLIAATPRLGGKTWQDFTTLVDFRIGLIHARASRPESFELPEEHQPLPLMRQLQSLQAGWAVRVITQLIADLNSAAGTQLPDWLAHQ